MKYFLIFFLGMWPAWLGAQQDGTSTVEDRVTIYGGGQSLRVAMVQDSEKLISALDRLAGPLAGKPLPIVVQLYPPVQGKPSQIVRSFLLPEGAEDAEVKYRLQIDLRLGRGDSFIRTDFERVVLEMLLIERTLRALPEGEVATRVEIRPWLLDGMAEALLWQKNRGDRRMYESLVESGGWVEVEKLVDRTTVGEMDVLSRELFRASSGALVMALLAQPQGSKSMGEFLSKVATFEGEPLTLLRTHFPQVNLGAKGLERWWMLQVAAMSEKKLTEAMTIPETDERLEKILRINLRDAKDKPMIFKLDEWRRVAALETKEERLEALRSTADLLAHLSFRCFPTYRPVIGGYVQLLSDLAEGNTAKIDEVLGNLQTFRTAEKQRHEQLIDLMDWFHLSTVKEESGEFEDYLKIKRNLQRTEQVKGDPIQDYLDKVQKVFEEADPR